MVAARSSAMAMLLHRWFVQYNPLFFASALSVLLGVFLLTRDPLDWDRGQLGLAGVIQLYELALIAAAGFLFDLPGQRRPAVILGIVAIAFLFDISFRIEGLASVGTPPAVAVGWALLLAGKLALVARALRARIPAAHAAAWTLAALMLAIAPQLIGAGAIDRGGVLAAACWLGIALLALAAWGRPAVQVGVSLDDWGRAVLSRIVRAAPLLWTALYWAHVAAWCGIYELAPTAACFAPAAVLLPFVVRSEARTWIVCAIALAIVARWPVAFAPVAAMLAAGLALKAHLAHTPRLYVCALVVAYLAAAAFAAGGPKWAAPPLWITLAASAALVLLAWRYRLRSALAAAALAVVPALAPLLPANAAHWGAALLAAGFVALGAGVALNWWSSVTFGLSPRRLR